MYDNERVEEFGIETTVLEESLVGVIMIRLIEWKFINKKTCEDSSIYIVSIMNISPPNKMMEETDKLKDFYCKEVAIKYYKNIVQKETNKLYDKKLCRKRWNT